MFVGLGVVMSRAVRQAPVDVAEGAAEAVNVVYNIVLGSRISESWS